mmetsp:Transcript_28254/g.65354  ORF Transcript_28254/g.65354 Transcript_28254/m.65354 type:complete len:381 (-) Transcript_28254:111-1253(-)
MMPPASSMWQAEDHACIGSRPVAAKPWQGINRSPIGATLVRPICRLEGTWVNVDCPREQYYVQGLRVTRMDIRGAHHFSLHWDPNYQRWQWGTQGRLSLEWIGDDRIAWVPDSHRGRTWRWQRCTYTVPPPPQHATVHQHSLMRAEGGGGPRTILTSYVRREAEPPVPFSFEPRRRPRSNRNLGEHNHPYSPYPTSSYSSVPWSVRSVRSVETDHRHRNHDYRDPRDSRTHHHHHHNHRRYHRDQWRPRGIIGEYLGCGDGKSMVDPTGANTHLPCGLTPVEVCDLLSRDITPEDYDLLLRLDKAVEKKPIAADTVQALPSVAKEEFHGEQCAVCLGDLEDDEDVTALPCRHHFHRACISKWFAECHHCCPLCKTEALPT